MEDWALRAMQRWPNVPALFGWLGLDRRGRWLIRGEPITRPQIVDTINRNYAADALGRWFFQNGPQRGYVALEYAPLLLRTCDDGDSLQTHTGLPVRQPQRAYLDEHGALLLSTEHGPALLADAELDWALQRLVHGDAPVDEAALAAALALPSRTRSALQLRFCADRRLDVLRLDAAHAPLLLGFERDPQPRAGERATTGDGGD